MVPTKGLFLFLVKALLLLSLNKPAYFRFMHFESKYIEGMINGNHADFEVIYNMYASKLYRYAYSFLKNREKSEDLVQETFISLWNSREHIRNRESVSNLLFTTMKNRLINSFRATLTSPYFEDYMKYCNELCTKDSTESAVCFEDFCRNLEEAKLGLNNTQTKVFTLIKEKGFKNKEVAQELCISEQTVKNQLSIALKIIRDKLRNHLPVLVLISLFNTIVWYFYKW